MATGTSSSSRIIVRPGICSTDIPGRAVRSSEPCPHHRKLTPPALATGGDMSIRRRVMKQKIPGAVGVVIVIIVVVVLVVFGWRKISGGADADVTQEVIDRYQNMSKQTFNGEGSNGGSPN